ncbi:MAG: M20/M25/M40 family metallo-hydrolase, partial [Candidatus Eisenbacteria bacterium]|nr:M20/M25/M40 family metallo-hydrolase [Candidatus Eisenbacteria bacterium]
MFKNAKLRLAALRLAALRFAVIGPAALIALAALAPPSSGQIDPERLRDLVERLADPSLEGRGIGTVGIDRASEIVASCMQQAGLVPGGPDGGWYQTFAPGPSGIEGAVRLPPGTAWGGLQLRNVLGILRGSGEDWVLLGAHYDHLGEDGSGDVYPGADDNASGVAVLCEVARELAQEAPRPRSVLFVAFTGEEENLLGSRWYVRNPAEPLEKTIAMVNLDTIGRVQDKKLYVFGTASAVELPSILRDVDLGFSFDLAMPERAPMASDHVAFLEAGVPAIHIFSGPNADYHRLSDVPERLDYDALAEVGEFVAETVRFLAERAEPLTYVPPPPPDTTKAGGPGERPRPEPQAPRRVSLGTIPDFAWQGQGVKISGVLPGSPAEKAGMKAGDTIVRIGEETVATLEDFTAVLREHEPGDTIRVVFCLLYTSPSPRDS